MKKIIAIIFITIILVITIIQALAKPPGNPRPTLTPLSQTLPKHIIGFLPYWQIEQIKNATFPLLDEIIYFGLHLTEEGRLNKEDAGFRRLQSKTFADIESANGKDKISIAIILQDNEAIEIFLANSSARKQATGEILSLIETYGLGGINLDFEYSGIPGKETVQHYNTFIADLTRDVKKTYPTVSVSVDITADAVQKSRLYDVGTLASIVDYVILMGYDFYRPSSSVAGPVAPLSGKEIYEYDVTTAVADFLTHVPSRKLILGVPYYGWDFPTVDDTRGSFVAKRPNEAVALATYKRMQKLLEDKQGELRFDKESQTSWLVYKDSASGGTRQIWFEDEASLGKKYDLINKENLAGVAIWALGYNGEYMELETLLQEKFR